MLQKLNERIQGVVAWLVIILIAITFTLFGVDYYLQSHHTSNAIAVVNEQPISNQAFEANYRRSRSRIESEFTSTAEEKRLQRLVLDEMIKNLLTVQAARRFGFEVTTNQADAAIVNIPQFQEDGHFSSQRYQQALNAALFTTETFQSEVRQGMLLNQQRFGFIGSSFALPAEIERFVRLYLQTRDYEYLIIKPSLFEGQITVSPQAIAAFYKAHQKEFLAPERVSLDYIKLSLPEIKQNIQVSNEDITKYYEENKGNYLTPAQWKVSHIVFAIPANASNADVQTIRNKAEAVYQTLQKNPQQFEEMAATLSDDKLSTAEKGMLPWITAGQKDYDTLLANLSKPGQITKPERTKYGIELFKLIDYKPIRTQSIDEVRLAIKEQLASELAQSQYTKALEQLADLSYQTPDSLAPVTDALKLPVQKTQPFSRQGGTTDLTKNPRIINSAFNHEVLIQGNNSELVQLGNDAVVVLRVNQHFPATQLALEAVQGQIENKLKQQQSQAKAKELGAVFLSKKNEEKQAELIKTYQLQWQSVTNASRENDKNNPQLNEPVFALLTPDSSQGVQLNNGDYAVVKLKQIRNGELDTMDKEQRDSLVQQIEASYGMMDYDLYVSSLMRAAHIKKN